MTDIDLLKICNYIIENHATLLDASVHFGCSLSTIRNYIKRLEIKVNENKDYGINWREILNKIDEIKDQNQIEGKSKGGAISKKINDWTDEDIEAIAKAFLSNKWTLRRAKKELGNELGEKFSNLSKSTIYELLSRVKNPQLREKINLQFEVNLENFGNPGNFQK